MRVSTPFLVTWYEKNFAATLKAQMVNNVMVKIFSFAPVDIKGSLQLQLHLARNLIILASALLKVLVLDEGMLWDLNTIQLCLGLQVYDFGKYGGGGLNKIMCGTHPESAHFLL